MVKMAASICFQSSAGSEVEKVPIVSFPPGRSLSLLSNGSGEAPSLKIFKHSEEGNVRKRDWRIAVGRGQKMDYVGRNHGDYTSRAASTSKYLVGVLDKGTGKMKAYNAELFNLQPWIEREGDKVAPTVKDSALTRREKTDRLTEDFGSNKKKRAMHSRLRNKVSEESLQKTATLAAEAAKDISLPDDVPDAPNFDLMPPCDRETHKPSEIYRLEDVLSEKLMADLATETQSLLNPTEDEIKKWKEEKSYPLYILDHLPLNSRYRPNQLSAEQEAAVLIYMKVLMQITISRKRTVHSFTVLSDIPHSVKEHIVDTFFQETSMPNGKLQRVMTKLSKNKIMIHLLILALHIDGFRSSLEALQKDTGVAQKAMHQYVRSFGGKVTLVKEKDDKKDSPAGTAKRYEMELTAPLEVISRKPMRQKKRGR